jgi:hypothetical protein
MSSQPSTFNYKRDAKRINKQNIYVAQGMDACQTPPYALDPLLPYLNKFKTIWEPAAGEGYLVRALEDHKFNVVASDILKRKNFFDYEPASPWDCIITNPPFSVKFKWLARCYQLGRPFALLMPVETLGARTAHKLFKHHGVQIILLDRRVNFKMPFKGWDSSAQFPTAWFSWQLDLPSQIVYGELAIERANV